MRGKFFGACVRSICFFSPDDDECLTSYCCRISVLIFLVLLDMNKRAIGKGVMAW